MTNLLEMQELLRRFAEQREWEKFHRVRNLVLALVGEVGELAALIQWIADGEIETWLNDDSNRLALESEMADVLAYLVRLADIASVDLGQALISKTQLNETRYPQDRVKGSAEKYTKYE